MALNHTRNTLGEKIRIESVNQLSRGLVNGIDVQRQAKQAHWNVHGPGFIELHLLFDNVYNAAIEWADLCAERLVALGGVADGRVQTVAQKTELPTYKNEFKRGLDHAAALAEALAAYGEIIRGLIDASAEIGDATTSDVFTEISRGVDDHLWKVEAHLRGE
ncbi:MULTISPECIES: DNA starvation/stationary phase protection protein Dps [Pandoraea]|uniref:DNA-binding protein n=1 Tax=Pandoraea capi TaxID=2508286 RepID=A0ABY6VSG5_9BURK|nr:MULTISPECIES: DNA starvation/stationary phase protection protein Dps [Pandoraea]MCI3207765.1 DNA starvation/stationary phase protection protein Dps [Pandoraea sp. LA3]MDN4585794.1 DNA starvation/stationary phase protection protein Dps [Pandoraea capi]VVD82320.1 DNA-binding protein [Pandoraea capi]